jgi:N utilization substance protein B
MSLVIEIADYAEQRMEIKRNKLQPTFDELNPNTRFIENLFIKQLRANKQLKTYIDQKKLTWVNHPDLVKELYLILTESEMYQVYMAAETSNYPDERKFIEKIFNNIFLVSEELYEVLEEQSIYWNDDIEFVISVIIKTFKKFSENSSEMQQLMPLFKDEDDREFAKDLLRKSIINHDELQGLVKEHSNNWDVERIAFIDILLMQLSIAEFMYFPSIPTKVTLNEYIELSKFYSTEKSRNFINGILDKTLKDLKKEGKIKKTGRGLVGE